MSIISQWYTVKKEQFSRIQDPSKRAIISMVGYKIPVVLGVAAFEAVRGEYPKALMVAMVAGLAACWTVRKLNHG